MQAVIIIMKKIQQRSQSFSRYTVHSIRVTIDCELSLDKQHVCNLCKTEKTRKIVVHAFVLAHFTHRLNKMEKMQEMALRFITNDYNSSYKTLLNTTEMANMRVRQIRFQE